MSLDELRTKRSQLQAILDENPDDIQVRSELEQCQLEIRQFMDQKKRAECAKQEIGTLYAAHQQKVTSGIFKAVDLAKVNASLAIFPILCAFKDIYPIDCDASWLPRIVHYGSDRMHRPGLDTLKIELWVPPHTADLFVLAYPNLVEYVK